MRAGSFTWAILVFPLFGLCFGLSFAEVCSADSGKSAEQTLLEGIYELQGNVPEAEFKVDAAQAIRQYEARAAGESQDQRTRAFTDAYVSLGLYTPPQATALAQSMASTSEAISANPERASAEISSFLLATPEGAQFSQCHVAPVVGIGGIAGGITLLILSSRSADPLVHAGLQIGGAASLAVGICELGFYLGKC